MIEDMIKGINYYILGQKTTVCLLTLHSGFEVVGTSACVDPKDFDKEIGERFALRAAMSRLEELDGFQRQTSI